MVEAALPLSSWESYYVIIGSSAAALTGLNFVVIALGAESRTTTSAAAVRAFATPTIVHFCAVLLVSALLNAPWPGTRPVDLGLGACGIAGVVYVLLVMRHAVRQKQYQPVLEDWIWHGVLPFLAYVIILVAAIILAPQVETALFMVAGSTLLLLYVGIHNAWDAVTWMASKRQEDTIGGPK